MSAKRALIGNGAGLLCLLLALLTVGVGCQATQSPGAAVMGGARVQNETQPGPGPSGPPRTVYVEDFSLDYQNLQTDEGVRGRVGVLQRVPRLKSEPGPAEQARNLVNLMAESLVADLTDAGIPAQRLAPGGALPADGWLLHGTFVEVDEGSRLRRAVIGFGSGGSSMEVMVGVSDFARNPEAPFIIFGTVTDPSKLPGAVVSMNPYMAAAKFVMEKNATAKDVKRTSKEIVSEILKYRDKFKEEVEAPKSSQ